ncbi:MAG: hypothetical protein IJT72_08950 [Lachnospiraceae bacterium]|nr:hypothetical protein [Lachnospiraceae bacterium]
MYKVINEYLSMVNINENEEIYNRLVNFLDHCELIKKYSVNVNFQRYVVDIKLNNFSIDNAVDCFNRFNLSVSYPYSEMHIRFNEGKCIRYRYITSMESKEAFYCDIVIS